MDSARRKHEADRKFKIKEKEETNLCKQKRKSSFSDIKFSLHALKDFECSELSN